MRRQAFYAGLRAVAPMLAAVTPFGMAAGLAGLEVGLSAEMTLGMSVIIFAGASQLAAIQLIDANAAAPIIVITALLINLRMLMYSAHLGPYFSNLPLSWRAPMAYLLTDQAYALTISRFMTDTPPTYNHWFYMGVGAPLWVIWQLATAFGFWAGAAVPASWELGFFVPLIFLALLVPAIRNRPSLVAAAVAGSLSVLGRNLPAGLGLTTAALAGIIAGMLAEQWWSDD